MATINDPEDRIHFSPKHQGPTVFPNFFLFARLVRLASKPRLVAVRDVTYDYTATYVQLLTDVLYLRNLLRQQLDPAIIAKLEHDEEVFINLLGPGGYEYVVGFFAIMALGAVIVPISPDLPVKEATYFASKSRTVAVLTAARSVQLARDLEGEISRSSNPGFRALEITPHLMRPPLPVSEMQISSDPYLDLNKPGLVIFTSGTTGPPKGAVKRRGFLFDVGMGFADQYGLEQGDTLLHVLPVHHTTGISVNLLPFLFCGGCIEFRSGGFNAEWTWERIRRGGLTFFSGVPTIYMRLMQHYEQRLAKLPPEELKPYLEGVRGFKAMMCGTSALPRPLQDKWTKLRDGKSILTRYGGSEFGTGFMVTPWLENVPETSVGVKPGGVDLKLSEGDEGEVLIRSPVMFSKYLFDPTTTRQSITASGHFKSGDIARRTGDFYFILGRASVDIIKSGGYKISALDIERELLALPYISEAMVVGLADEEFGQRVAAAVVLHPDGPQSLTLEKLREDLRSQLAGYKMPTAMRVVGELRKNATGKVMKKELAKEIFPERGHDEVQVWRSGGRRKEKL